MVPLVLIPNTYRHNLTIYLDGCPCVMCLINAFWMSLCQSYLGSWQEYHFENIIIALELVHLTEDERN